MEKKIFKFSILCLVCFCSQDRTNFSSQANSFLNAINTKEYNGVNTATGSEFRAHDTLIAEYRSDGRPGTPRVFQNTRHNGTSETEGIYKVGRTNNQWQGIQIQNGGDSLLWTSIVDTEEKIDWNAWILFAEKK